MPFSRLSWIVRSCRWIFKAILGTTEAILDFLSTSAYYAVSSFYPVIPAESLLYSHLTCAATLLSFGSRNLLLRILSKLILPWRFVIQICSKEEGFGELDFFIYPFHVSVISSASFTLLAGIHFLLKILSSKNKYNTMCESINFVFWSILKQSHIFGLIAGLVNFLQLFGNKQFVFFLPLTNHLRNVWHKVSVKKKSE